MHTFRLLLIPVFLFLFAGRALALDLFGELEQGGMVLGKAEPGSKVFLDGQKVRISGDGTFVFGFGREFGSNADLKVVWPDGKVTEKTLTIAKHEYKIDRIDGLPEDKVTVPESELKRREKETGMVKTARAAESNMMNWAMGFILPAEGRISGVYGSQRILNGKPRWPHYGLDIANDVGTPVKAPAGGIVRLAEKDFLLEGGIMIIDHGFGVSSTLMHLSRLDVKVGDRVEQGQVVGAIGMTGRATGPHVDWRVNWGTVRLDPALVLKAHLPEGQ